MKIIKKRWILVLSIIFAVICVLTSIGATLSFSNYQINKKEWDYTKPPEIIHNQHDYPNLKYGFGSVAKNGCGAIAVYNILFMENKYKPLPEIIKFFDNNNENLYGVLGTNPFSIMIYMQNEGYKTNFYLNSNIFKEKAKNSKYSIMFYFNLKGGHYQLIYNYNEETNLFNFINASGQTTMENYLNQTKNCFRMLITIN